MTSRFADSFCVVTGGAGFIGSHLVDKLLAEGAEVLALDDFSTGSRENLPKPGMQLQVIKADVSRFFIGDVVTHAPRRFVFNLASPASPVAYGKAQRTTLRTNSAGTDFACALAHQLGATLLQASTSEVYGQPEVHPQHESYVGAVNPVGPRSCYDEGKRYAEALVTAWAREAQLKVRIARIHNTYGPRMQLDDGRVVPAMLKAAAKNEPFPIFGDGSQTRCFCYVDDMVEGLLRLALSDVEGPVNLGSNSELSMMELAAAVSRATGKALHIERHPLPGDDPLRRRPNLTRAQTLLDWGATVSLDEGLKKTYADVVSRLNAR